MGGADHTARRSARVSGPRVNSVVSGTMQGFVAVAAAAAQLTSDGSSAVFLQTLAVIGMSSCGQATLKGTLHNTVRWGRCRLVLMASLGVLIGNFAIVLAVTCRQFAVVAVVMRLREMAFADAASLLRSPSLAIVTCYSLFQGTFFSAAQLLSLPGSTASERSVGAVVYVTCVIPVVAVWYCRTHALRQFLSYEYQRTPNASRIYGGILQQVFLPRGRLEPSAVRHRLGVFFSSFMIDRMEIPVLPLIIPSAFSLLTTWHPAGKVECTVWFSTAILAHLAVAVWVLYWTPYRYAYGSLVALWLPTLSLRAAVTSIVTAQIVLQVVRILLPAGRCLAGEAAVPMATSSVVWGCHGL